MQDAPIELLDSVLFFNKREPLTRGLKRLLISLSVLVFAYLVTGLQAHAQCSSPANAIVAENCLTGNSDSEWDLPSENGGDTSIQGFASDISVNQGQTVTFKISTPASAYTIDIYRMGYYGGLGARKITSISPSARLPQTQPACKTDTTVGLIDCGNWAASASWAVPATATSGIYFAKLKRTDTGGSSHILFIVRNDSSHSAILYQTSDETWQAYNYYGAGSLYGPAQPNFDANNRSYKVSYNRPILTRGFEQESDSYAFGPEFAMIQWIEQNGYDVTYFTGVDASRYGSLIKNHKIMMDSGHDEYWSLEHRNNVEAARDAGVNLAFFAGNSVFWKTRWENSIDGTNTPYKTMTCYKETFAFAKIDPSDPPTWTGTWRDPSFSPPADGNRPENSLLGTMFMVNGLGPDNDGSHQIQIPAADGKMRFWRNTAVANLSASQTYTLPKGTLGYEWDEDIDNGARPAGLFRLSSSTVQLTTNYLLDYGATYGAGTSNHHLTMYRAASGALVFSSGTINWSWGLNQNHDNPFNFASPAPDVNMQQATVNLFADMGVQPATLQSGLVSATASTDTAPPASVITSPASGTTVNTGSAVTVTGTATDSGGVVGGVEVSGDGGTTWHPATGRGAWSYTWTPTTTGTTTLMARAVDDSGNLETAHGITITVAPQTCPCSIWNGAAAPQNVDSGDSNSIEVGMKFRADSDGSVLGVRFYKASTNTGTHIAHLWSNTGSLLGTATFSAESAAGWQTVNFSSPIPVSANTTYVVSYYSPSGHYSADSLYFVQSGVNNPPLHALANGVDGSDGIYIYAASPGAFPTNTFRSTNYWVDVIFTSSNTFSVSGTISGFGGAGATLSLSGSESISTTADYSGNFSFGGVPNGTYTITPSNSGVTFTPASRTVTVSGSVVTGVGFSAVATNPQTISGSVTGLPSSSITVNLSGTAAGSTTTDSSGNFSFTGLLNGTYTITPTAPGAVISPGSRTVTLTGSGATQVTFQASQCNCISIWSSTTTPAVIDANDGTPVELGVRFTTTAPGFINGLRFYKASTNTGAHVAHLWSNTGTLLATATFSGESPSGWQQVAFSSPVAITANTTYIASYFAPVGHYSADTSYFASTGTTNGPLQAPVSSTSSPNGIYLYTSSGGFPSNTYAATNYWVDVLYSANQSYTVSGKLTGADAAGATLTLTSSTGTSTTTADSSGNYNFSAVFPGSYSVTPSNTNAIFIPGNQSINVSSASIANINFSESPFCPCGTIWLPSSAPAAADIDGGDGAALETGVKFQADFDGYVLGVRYYKAAANGGTHIGNLWAGDGSAGLLASSAFAAESSTGWQQVTFANPVPVKASTTYLASYFGPQGHYSHTANYFASAGVDSPPLHALSNGASPNGVYTYSAASTYPSSTYGASNYWVDVIYFKATTHTISGSISGAAGANATVTISGPVAATVTADGTGKFSFDGLSDGTYTITPSATNVTFSPASQTITVNGGHVLGVSFSASGSYSISGTISGAAGVSVALSGTATATTTIDGSGNYSFNGLPNGNYTVTPSLAGYAMSPSNQSVPINNASASGVNFAATVLTYTVSGTITGGAGATVLLSGAASAQTTADSTGNFSFSGLANGNYMVTPASSGRIFSPASLAIPVASANISGVAFSVPANCPCNTIWQPSVVPTNVDPGDDHSSELGVVFKADADGYIAGVRFYKAPANTGTHTANLWSSSGVLLGTVNFSSETASGWQQITFANPVPVSGNTAYVASYFAPAGHYSGDSGFFTSAGVDTPPLHALQNGTSGANGIYQYSSTSTFPTQTYNAANYWVDVIYLPTTTYSVTGTISGPGGSGATINLTGAATASATADTSGNFNATGLANGTYVVTPTAQGYSFSPASQSVTVNNGHVMGLTFTSQVQTYTISGTISGAGGVNATVALAGSSTATTTADVNGAYSFTGLSNGSFTVTASKSGYIFTPPSAAVTVNYANATANFTSAAIYTITGTVSGAGGANATVTLSGGASATVTANSSGAYSFTGIVNGSYTVTPSKTGYYFTPASAAVTVSGANATANFATAATYVISGTISGAGGASATVTLSGGVSATVTANSSGVYSFPAVPNGSYTVTPTKAGYAFTPTNRAVPVNGANVTANFTSALTYTISGTISGAGGVNATVILSGAASATVTANASGVYSFPGIVNGSYTVTPTKASYAFTPTNRAVTVNGANATANFTSAATYTLSGTLAGGANATVALTGTSTATATADASGAYTFTGLVNGSYTVTPSKAGYAFTPTNRAVTINGANVTANFTAAAAYTISGTISGAGGAGATVSLSGASTATATANSSGVYTFTGVVNGSYTVTASKAGYIFTPTSQAVTVSSANATANFSSTAQTYSMTGTISGSAGSGATVKLTGAGTATVTANSSGVFTFTGLLAGTYTVTPTKSGRIILPTSRSVTITTSNVTGVNFSTLI